MKRKSGKIKVIISVVAIAVVLSIGAALFLPGLSQKEINNYLYVSKKQAGIDYSPDNSINISAAYGALTVNKENAGVALVSKDGEVVFNSCSKDAAKYSLANVLSIRTRDEDGNSYTMNSTDNSVKFGTFKIEKKSKTRISVVFDFYPDKKAATAQSQNGNAYVSIPVTFVLEKGGFKVSVDTKNIILPEGNYLERISILPGLFAVENVTGDEFFIVPDGCGAKLDPSAVTEKEVVLNLPVYGSDVAFYDYTQGAILPFFALSKGDVLVNSIITGGDALSEISCKKAENGGGYLYNTFTVTACGVVEGKFRVGNSYEGELSQSYFISSKGDYNDVSEQVRDNLIERGYLSAQISGKFVDLPFFINVLGSPDGETITTSFENAAEITGVLKTRGVRNTALRYSGAFKKGVASHKDDLAKFNSEAGGKDGFKSMAGKIKKQNNTTWLDINLYTGKANSQSKTVKNYEEILKFSGYNGKSFSLNSTNMVNSNISKTYKMLEEIKNVDVCINDASMYLYTDLKGGLNRQQVLENIKEKSGALSAKGGVMLAYPAVYLMSEADAVFNIPAKATLEGVSGVTSVPVLQMVLHGSLVYSSGYMNITNLSPEDALLKAIEYGSVPAFLFTHGTNSNLNYNMFVSYAAELYGDAKKLLPVMDMKITSHEVVVPDVYKITYDYNKVIYVNYNPAVVEVNGVMISAKDYVII